MLPRSRLPILFAGVLASAGLIAVLLGLTAGSEAAPGPGAYNLLVPGIAADNAPPGTLVPATSTPTTTSTPTVTVTPSPTPIPPGIDLVIHIHAFRVSDDGGVRQAHVTPQQVSDWVAFTNTVYAPAGIAFLFDPAADFSDVNQTLLTDMTGTGHPLWEQQRTLANAVQAIYPGSFAVFFRWGPDALPTGGGFSWYEYNFVTMGGWDDMEHCGHPHWEALAHEFGHFFGLPHTFAVEPFIDQAAAEAYFVANGPNQAIFDGDGFADTAPDPGIRTLECPHTNPIILAGVPFNLPRTNIMSYYDEASSLTSQQIARVRWLFGLRQEGAGGFRANSPANPIEAESFPPAMITSLNGSYSVQPMGWGPERFSGGQQIFWVPNPANGSISFKFGIATAGTFKVSLYATQAPDYGIVSVTLDGVPLPALIDGYAPLVVPSGKVVLATPPLNAGVHEIKFEVVGKNALSSDYRFGFDAFELEEQ